MSAVATPTYPASRPDQSLDGEVVLPGDARYDGAWPSFRACSQEASTTAMTCKWVHANDGGLVMEWAAAGVSRTVGYPAGDEPAAIPGVTAIRERASW
jgi:hypothetical protein